MCAEGPTSGRFSLPSDPSHLSPVCLAAPFCVSPFLSAFKFEFWSRSQSEGLPHKINSFIEKLERSLLFNPLCFSTFLFLCSNGR